MHSDEVQAGRWLGMVLRGWFNYFAVPASYSHLRRFEQRVIREWMTILHSRLKRTVASREFCTKVLRPALARTPVGGG